MKKLATLILAAGLVCGSLCGVSSEAQAIDFKGKGNFTMSFDYGHGGRFMTGGTATPRNKVYGYNGEQDMFEASQRVRLQLDVIASEALSGTVYFEIGQQIWGKAGGDLDANGVPRYQQGANLGTDGVNVKVRYAYLDWVVPNTELKVRMGLQNIALPAYAMGASQIFDEDVAGIALNNQFNENIGLTFFWARPYNDNYNGQNGVSRLANYLDNFDLFGLVLPMSFDGVKISPFAMIGAWGPNAAPRWSRPQGGDTMVRNGDLNGMVRTGMLPAVMSQRTGKGIHSKGYAVPFWLGVTGEITMADPFRFAFDVNYGHNGQEHKTMRRAGWLATALAEYKMDWGTPGLYLWYGSGDDSNTKNGSERMPTFGSNQSTNGYSWFGANGNPQIVRESVMGTTPFIGTWGIGARLKDMSFMDDMKTTFAINWFNGTNSPKMAKAIRWDKRRNTPNDARRAGRWDAWNGFPDGDNTFNGNPDGSLYLTTLDYALEFNLVNSYKLYDNLTLFAEASYIALFLNKSQSVWGSGRQGRGPKTTDAWNLNVAFMYDF